MIRTTPPWGSGCAPAGSSSRVIFSAFMVLPQAPKPTPSACSRSSIRLRSGSMVLVRNVLSAGPWTTSSMASMLAQPPTPSIVFWMLPRTKRALSTPASLRWYTTLCFWGRSLRCEARAAGAPSSTSAAASSAIIEGNRRRCMSASIGGAGLDHGDPRSWVEPHSSEIAQVLGDHVGGRGAVHRRPDRGPADRLVASLRAERPAVDPHLGDPASHRLPRVDRVGEPADPQHV